MKATSAVVLAPATSVKHGYVVAIGKQLSIVTKLHFGEDSDLKLYVGNGMPPIAVPPNRRRRMRAKGPAVPPFRIWGKRSVRALGLSSLRDTMKQEDAQARGCWLLLRFLMLRLRSVSLCNRAWSHVALRRCRHVAWVELITCLACLGMVDA